MNKIKMAVLAWLLVLLPIVGTAFGVDARREIQFPDLPGYRTLACDLHMHTIFSDGQVWPTVRVAEAWRQGLDAISITDHIEYRPHKDDMVLKHGRSHELAVGAAKAANLLLVRGAEITRDTPPGHFNALFLDDIQPLDTKEFLDAIKAANAQGAFVMWNHQGWQGEEKGRWMDVHTQMLQNKWFQGMEICNGDEYYPTAHQWALDHKLTMLGDTDIHVPDLRQASTSSDHRTMTLVFAKDRTLTGLKEALFAGRTLVWFKDQLIGREEWLRPLFNACVKVGQPTMRAKNYVIVEVRNVSNADIRLERCGKAGPAEIVLPAGAIVSLRVSAGDTKKPIELNYMATNLLIAPKKGLPVTLRIPGP
jgi:hypothetical protein